MKIYIFNDSATITKSIYSEMTSIIERVSNETDVSDLVVSVYFSKSTAWTGGVAMVRQWQSPPKFINRRGRWNITCRFGTPTDLPSNFKLIRLLLPANLSIYPKTETDIYHWQHTFATWQDHLAHLYAHELHHFRRYHLGLHPREGEHSANRWAQQTVDRLEFNVKSERLKTVPKKVKKKTITFSMVVNPMDFGYASMDRISMAKLTFSLSTKTKKKYTTEKLKQFDQLRQLAPGETVNIAFDPTQRYLGQKATVIRVMRKNSVRMVIRTQDGKEWRWPLAWLIT